MRMGIELLLSGIGFPSTLALDVANHHMYFFSQVAGQVYRLHRADLDGQNLIVIGDVPGWNFSGLSLDPVNRKLYWVHLGANNVLAETGIFRSNFDLTNKEHLVTPSAVSMRGLSLDLAGGMMYWGESYPRDVIRKATLDGQSQAGLRRDRCTGSYPRAAYSPWAPEGLSVSTSSTAYSMPSAR